MLTSNGLGRTVAESEQRTAGGQTTLLRRELGYDAAGRLVSAEWGAGPCDQVACQSLASVAWDLDGNRVAYELLGEATSSTFDARARLRQVDGSTEGVGWQETWNHTPNGEVATIVGPEGTTDLTWDSYGSLIGAVTPSGDEVAYRLDALGRRTTATRTTGADVETRTYLYTRGDKLALELDEQGEELARYVYASRPHVPDLVEKGGATYRLVVDERGSVRAVVDVATGAVAQELEYGPFGEVLLDTSPGFQAFEARQRLEP